MKIAFLAILGAVIGIALFGLTSCATIQTTVTSPDGTVTVTRTTAPDAASVAALSSTAQAFAPRAVVVHPSK